MEYKTPYYIVYEEKLRKNIELITGVAQRTGADIIMAFKANALWRTFDIFREYGIESTASSLNEMLLAIDELKCRPHTYCPAYTDETIDAYIAGSSHITFNSVEQYMRFADKVKAHNNDWPGEQVSCGLRVNPMCSVIETDIYNPCCPGSRFGVLASDLDELPEGIEGFHFHALCESTSFDLEKVLLALKQQFGKYLPQLKWLNMGGGHLMTRKGYNIGHLEQVLGAFRGAYPNLQIILEPGSAWCWQTGDLEASVVDVVANSSITTAIIDASFACHMPDCLEMPYKPKITQALEEVDTSKPTYRMGGNSCLSGDYVGDWSFEKPLQRGDRITFEDMNHYTTVKTNMFNGIQHPSILLKRMDGSIEVLREFDYIDYKSRMS
ncbi:MAG: carboxynorspermidine decarboxylase [Muribaculaceae bacterium]|nr:carboxynorspermidine decarboxylase [Muribaculaceae bacterium]MBQ7205663.1 carboxynorspermidine decarboxylase [Muribaculaceae bacterium]